MWRTKTLITQSTSDLSTTHHKFIWEHHIWCHVNISEVVTLVSMIPNFWCTLEVVAAELHLCFVITGNLWWKSTFLPTVTFVVSHQKCRRWIVFSSKTSNTKINCKTTGRVPSQIWPFPRVKPCLEFLVNPFNV